MVTQELIENITRRLSQGQRREDIKEALMATGWEDIDIDEAFSTIQKEALKQIPFIAWWMNLMSGMDKKTANLSVPMTIGVFIGAALLVILVAYGLYLFLDPFNAQGAARDRQRADMLKQIHVGVDKYFAQKNVYPASLNDLVPTYLQTVPVDPKSHNSFDYQVSHDRISYQLCMEFETDSEQCIGTGDISSDAQPTYTPSTSPSDIPNSISPSDSPKTYTINGIVFKDPNKDGKMETGEQGIANKIVTVMDLSTSKNACDVQSDAQGNFSCTLSGIGIYNVSVEMASGESVTTLNPQPVSFPIPDHPEQTSKTVMFGISK